MQRKIKLLTVGKVKYSWIDAGIREYVKRIPGLTIVEIKDTQKRTDWAEVVPHVKTQDQVVVLTERGMLYNSIDFATFIEKTTLDYSLLFVIGSSDGITPELERSAHHRLALSPMTFTHDMARLLLVEQLYRATSIVSHGNYHK
jgi:23S rRNA (pseudouridine1915-N3)-methyltransferase